MFRSAALVLCLLVSVHCVAGNEKQGSERDFSTVSGAPLQENKQLTEQFMNKHPNVGETSTERNHDENKQGSSNKPQSTDRPLRVNDPKSQINHETQENPSQTVPKVNDNQTKRAESDPKSQINHETQENPSQTLPTVNGNQTKRAGIDAMEGLEKKGSETEEEEEDDNGEEEVCFDYVGCFHMGRTWKSLLRPVSAPVSPEEIQTKVFFYSRENPVNQKNITLYPRINMGEAHFDPNKLSVIIVHGFASSGNSSWMKDMKDAYLKHVDANAMIVDWGKGASSANYLQVAGNTRVVGRQLAMFVNYLIQNHGANPGKFHLIGHSLGAHICSYLGKEVHGIARLTALDPAQPGFEGFSKKVRLHKSDARFVDVIHTDARPFIPTLGFGMMTPHGHVDFYMNGGFDQPACIAPPKKELPRILSILDLAKYPVEVISKMVACPHGRAYEYLIEAFNETEKCIFWGHEAHVTNIFRTVTNTVTQGIFKKLVALSPVCSKNDCVPLGFATKKSSKRGVFVVTTSGRKPFCISEPGVVPEVSSPVGGLGVGRFIKNSKLVGFAKSIIPY